MKNNSLIRRSISGLLVSFFGVMLVTLFSIFLYLSVSETLKDNIFAVMLIMFLAVLFISILIMIIDIVWRRRNVDRQVDKILEATDRITEGQFDVDLQPAHAFGRYNEFDMIMVNIDRMVKELAKNEMLKTDFIANVSHEIKTPLAIIQNYATMMRGADLTEQERDEYSLALVNASKHLTELVTNILKLSKLENRTISEPKKSIDLSSMLSESILQFEDVLDEKNINVECDIDDVTAYAEKTNFDILFNNLISNAIKFSHKDGTVRVALKLLGAKAVFSVEDFGEGMTEETGRHIFDKFYQGDSSHSKEGNGLGLALVKRVIDVIGGEITVESELGCGSKFTVKFDVGAQA